MNITREELDFSLYARAVPGMHRAGPGERGGGSYGRRTVATAERAAMQISGVGKGKRLYTDAPRRPKPNAPSPVNGNT